MTDLRYQKLAKLLASYSCALKKGEHALIDVTDIPDEFVLTPSVRSHLATLARAVLLRKHPILLQVRGFARMFCLSFGRSGALCGDAKHSSD